MSDSDSQIRKVVHVELKTDPVEHHYFGSLAAIYDYMTKEDVGISYTTLRNLGLSVLKPYENRKCIIRVGALLPKKQKSL